MNIDIEMELTAGIAINGSLQMTYIMSSNNILSVNTLFVWILSTPHNRESLMMLYNVMIVMCVKAGHVRRFSLTLQQWHLEKLNSICWHHLIKMHISQFATGWRLNSRAETRILASPHVVPFNARTSVHGCRLHCRYGSMHLATHGV